MNKNSKIYVAGHTGLVGSALMRRLEKEGHHRLIVRTHAELDLTHQNAVARFFENEKPEYVFLAAAKVGGIGANNLYPADFIFQNISIQTNIIHQSYLNRVQRLLFMGSSCIYPRLCPQPIQETSLLTGPLEPTNEPYAIAKIAGIKMCQAYNKQYETNYLSVMPTNLYGPNDNFNLETSHVIPALVRKFHEAKINNTDSVTLWGTGKPRREFLHVDDLASAGLFLMNLSEKECASLSLINIGTGIDLTIDELARKIAFFAGFKGRIHYDSSKPDGTPQKLLDVSRLKSLGWKASIPLDDGLKDLYLYYSQK